MIKSEKVYRKFIAEKTKEICLSLGLPTVTQVLQEVRISAKPFEGMQNIKKGQCRIDILAIHEDESLSLFELKIKSDTHNMSGGITQLLTYESIISENKPSSKLNLFLVTPEEDIDAGKMCRKYNLPVRLIVATQDYFSEYESIKANNG